MRHVLLAGVLLAALAVAGCGLGAGEGARGVSVTVTGDFGARPVGVKRVDETKGGETVMRFLQRSFAVKTRYGGGFVQSIEGLSGGSQDGRPVDWFFYVNGIESSKGAASVKLNPGDRVWWDRHDWGAAQAVPAVVGSYPEPFRSGAGGRLLPTTVTCATSAGAACETVKDRLQREGVKVSSGTVGAASGASTLRVLVGPWRELRADGVAGRLDDGPRTSGVFARFDRAAARLTLLDERARATRTLGAGAGLLAALRDRESQPTWVVTGTDAAGVLAAARALDEDGLRNRFALAVSGGRGAGLPEVAR